MTGMVFRRETTINLLGIEFRASPVVLIVYFLMLGAIAALSIYYNATTRFWLDETFTGAMACQPSFAEMMPLIRHDAHPVLYHILIHLIFALTGCNLWIVRGLSLVCSFAAIVILLRQVERRGGNVFLAAAIMLANPTFWNYAFEARSYSMLFLAGSGVVAYGLSDRPRSRIIAVAFALMGGLLHYYASFLFAVLFLIVTLVNKPAERSKRFWITFFGAGLLLTLYYIPQMKDAISFGTNLRWIQKPHLSNLLIDFPAQAFGNLCSAAVLLFGSMFTLFHNSIRMRKGFLLLAIFFGFIVALFLMSFYKPMFVYRYTHFLIPAAIMGFSLILNDKEKAKNISDINTNKYIYEEPSPSSIVAFLYIFLSLYFCIFRPISYRDLSWEVAMRSMTCAQDHPCAFVLDDPFLPSLDADQYTVLANFFANTPGSFVALRPGEAVSWIEQRPNGQLLYVRSFAPSLKFKDVIASIPLTCHDFRHGGTIGSLTCRSNATAPR